MTPRRRPIVRRREQAPPSFWWRLWELLWDLLGGRTDPRRRR